MDICRKDKKMLLLNVFSIKKEIDRERQIYYRPSTLNEIKITAISSTMSYRELFLKTDYRWRCDNEFYYKKINNLL